MPRQRIQVDSGIPTPVLKPAAAPVDTFVQPAAGKDLEQLAQGLAQLSPALGRFSDVIAKQTADADFSKGQQKARDLAQSATSFRDAIRSGAIMPSESPWFMAGLHEQFGRLAADRMNFDLMNAMTQDENLQTTTDPADFDKFLTQFTGQWQKDNLDATQRDSHFDQGFGAKSDAYIADAQRTFASQLGSRVQHFAGDGHFSEVMNTILTESGRHTSPDQIALDISGLMDRAVNGMGSSGELINQRTVDAVVATAKRLNDSSILDLLDHIQTGKADKSGNRPSLATTKYGADASDQAGQDIATENAQRQSAVWAAHQHAKEQATSSVFNDFVSGAANMGAAISRLTALGDGDKVTTLYQIGDAMRDHTYVDDPRTVASLFRRIHSVDSGETYTTVDEASRALAQKSITAQTYRSVVSDLDERERNGGVDPLEHDGLFKRGRTELYQLFVDEFGTNTQQTRFRGGNARDQFYMDYVNYRHGQGKDATAQQSEQWLIEEKRVLFARFADKTNFGEAGQAPAPTGGGPLLPNPAKEPLALPSDIEALAQEWTDVTRGRRNSLSARSMFILQYSGVHAEPNAISEFINQQRRIGNSLSRPDSTQAH